MCSIRMNSKPAEKSYGFDNPFFHLSRADLLVQAKGFVQIANQTLSKHLICIVRSIAKILTLKLQKSVKMRKKRLFWRGAG